MGLLHGVVCISGLAIGSENFAQEREIAQAGNKAPKIESASGEHDVIGGAGPSIGRSKFDAMTGFGQHQPTPGAFGGIEVETGQGHKNF